MKLYVFTVANSFICYLDISIFMSDIIMKYLVMRNISWNFPHLWHNTVLTPHGDVAPSFSSWLSSVGNWSIFVLEKGLVKFNGYKVVSPKTLCPVAIHTIVFLSY